MTSVHALVILAKGRSDTVLSLSGVDRFSILGSGITLAVFQSSERVSFDNDRLNKWVCSLLGNINTIFEGSAA